MACKPTSDVGKVLSLFSGFVSLIFPGVGMREVSNGRLSLQWRIDVDGGFCGVFMTGCRNGNAFVCKVRGVVQSEHEHEVSETAMSMASAGVE